MLLTSAFELSTTYNTRIYGTIYLVALVTAALKILLLPSTLGYERKSKYISID